ncbi:MAG: tRNA (adenosine(37)-N6)-threonylcarbamoyltransferase complex transferase subunit TsaD [Gemmatimonadales bacterium]|nr:tRNA (adenosine(37)-N6)-threonylcarbamoyltransferase complex transferase subunit TsaD [Gemmatimonadales bacterium]
MLGIETSCDETSAAVLRSDRSRPTLDSLVILSQDVHRVFGGVVPELASREHLKTLGVVVEQTLQEAGVDLRQLGGVAVTAGPGLVGALLVGVMYGKTLAYSLDLPLIGVNHLEGHIFAPTLEHDVVPPFLCLLVSGGHTMLIEVRHWGEYYMLGETRDDAAGEAFDKVAKLLGLGYPGGPVIERLAAEGESGRYVFPRPMLRALAADRDPYAFSFSGLKTAVVRTVRGLDNLDAARADIARGFQDAVIEVLVEKTARAADTLGSHTVVVGGGVACNRALIDAMTQRLADRATVVTASPRLNTDNAAMIAAAGAWRLERGERSPWSLAPRDDLPIPGLHPSPPVPATAS